MIYVVYVEVMFLFWCNFFGLSAIKALRPPLGKKVFPVYCTDMYLSSISGQISTQ